MILQTNHGDITLALDAENAPATVANFLQYVRDGHYDNTVFHRVIDGFMIQGGGFEPGMKQKPTRAPVANEAGNGLKNKQYTVAMARTSDPHSATGAVLHQRRRQRLPRLQVAERRTAGATACSARSSAGQDVVERIKWRARRPTAGMHQNVPKDDVVILKAEDVRQADVGSETQRYRRPAIA